ncbi:MAG TPA: hypothetical protein VNO50_05320 [Pyrinomonadaceae bacterium]|nr:hypothetical protein [Pyrinomonadaceae bacterium]
MTEEAASPEESPTKGIAWESLAKAMAWPLVAILAILLFREQIATLVPRVEKLTVGSLSIEAKSKLGGRAAPDVLSALEGLTENSIATLIFQTTDVGCYYQNPNPPPLDVESARNQRAQLIKKGLLEEIGPERLKNDCSVSPNPVFGVRRTLLGERVRDFQISVLSELSAPAQGR